MKSRVGTATFQVKQELLRSQLAEVSGRADRLGELIQRAGRQTIEVLDVDGGKQAAVISLADTHLHREYGDALREKCRLQYELGEIEFMLSPPRGRPRGVSQSMRAALQERDNANGRKPSFGQLAIKHSGSKDPKEQKRFAENLSKLSRRTYPKNS